MFVLIGEIIGQVMSGNMPFNTNVNYEEEIKDLKSNINNLVCEIELLKRELQDMRKE